MILSEFKKHLKTLTEVPFLKLAGNNIRKYFRITEVGQINKRFIDCVETVRNDIVISMQLWKSVDFWHKLDPNKLNTIIKLSEKKLGIDDHKIEIEYQSETIGKYGVKFDNGIFILTCRNTAYPASYNCGIPSLKTIKEKTQSYCTPGGDCY